jgi:hypothetical protein
MQPLMFGTLHWRRTVSAGVAALFALGFFSAAPARALATRTPLPISSFYDMTVDDSNGHVFVSGGSETSDLVVMDTQGNVAAQVPVAGATGMVLVGTTLYVAAADSASIDAIDTTASPPAVTSTIDISPLSNPQDLAYLDGRLWFTAASPDHPDLLNSVDTDGTGLSVGSWASWMTNPMRFVSADTGGNLVYVYDSSSSLHAFDVSSVPPTELHSKGGFNEIADATLLPGANDLAYASGSPYNYPVLATSDFSAAGEYGVTNPYPTAVAASAAYGGLLAGGSNSAGSPDVWTFHLGTTQAFWSYDFNDGSIRVAPHGMAWSADGNTLYVVSSVYNGTSPAFTVFKPPSSATKDSTVQVSANPSRIVVGGSSKVLFHLSGGDTNRTLDIYAEPVGEAETLIEEKPVDSNGNLSLSVSPRVSTIYSAYYDGDGVWLPSSGKTTVKVQARFRITMEGWSSRSGKYFVYRTGVNPKVDVELIPNSAGRWIRGILQAKAPSGWKTVSTTSGQLDANSSAVLVLKHLTPSIPYRLEARFGGYWLNTACVSGWRYVKVLGGTATATSPEKTSASF